MEVKDKIESHHSKEEKKDENKGKLQNLDKNATKPGVTKKNVDKRRTSLVKSGLSGENASKIVSPSRNVTKPTANTKTPHKTGVVRRNSKQRVKPVTSTNSDTKRDSWKGLTDKSNNNNNANIKPCETDTKKEVSAKSVTNPRICVTKPDETNHAPDLRITDDVKTGQYITDTKQDMKGENVTKPIENDTSDTDTLLNDTNKSEASSTDTIVDDTDISEETALEMPNINVIQGNSVDNGESDEEEVEPRKKTEPKAGVTIKNLIDDAAAAFEDEDYPHCLIICDEILHTDWKDPSDQEEFSLAYLYIGKSYEKLDELPNALKFYRFSLAVTKNTALSKHVEEIAIILEQQKRDSAEEVNKQGNDCFKAKQFREALKLYTEAIKRNPEQAKFYGNRSACYLKLKEYLLSLSDAQTCINFDPKSVKGYFREGAAYTALNKPSKACASYSNILQIDPDNEDAKKHYSKSTEKARLDPNDPIAVKKRIEEEPELIKILNDQRVRSFLGEMERDPTAVKNYMHDFSTRRKIQKLLECGLLNAKGPNPLLRS